MQAIITRNHNDVVGQMTLEPDMSLVDVAQSIFEYLPVDDHHAVGSQPMSLAFHNYRTFPSAYVILPNDAMYEQYRVLRVQDLPALFEIGRNAHQVYEPLPTLEIKIRPFRSGLGAFTDYLGQFNTAAAPTTTITTTTVPTTTAPTTTVPTHRWVMTRDREGIYRLLDEAKPVARPTGKVRLGSRYDSYSRPELVAIVQGAINTNPDDIARNHRYLQAIMRGSKGDLFEIIKEIVPIQVLDV